MSIIQAQSQIFPYKGTICFGSFLLYEEYVYNVKYLTAFEFKY